MSPTLQRLLAQLGPGDRVDFSTLADALYDSKYTGITMIHWLNGRPKQVDLGSPVRLSIVEGLDKTNHSGSG